MWSCPRALVYRAVDVLVERKLIRKRAPVESALGPARTLLAPTPAGRRALDRWLDTPVLHLRDVRSELLLKLLLDHRLGRDSTKLVAVQRAAFGPLAESLQARVGTGDPFEQTLALWRHTTAQAALRFLDRLADETGGSG